MILVKLDTPIYDGDWHDAPLKWQVRGPEVQNFSTKKMAMTWMRLRNKMSFDEAQRMFMRAVMKEITE